MFQKPSKSWAFLCVALDFSSNRQYIGTMKNDKKNSVAYHDFCPPVLPMPKILNFVPITVGEALLWMRALNTCAKNQTWYEVAEFDLGYDTDVFFFMVN